MENSTCYEFVLDTQFLPDKQILYDEIVMIKNIIDILEDNRKFVLSRFKKYSLVEYQEERRKREEASERMLESLKMAIMGSMNDGSSSHE